MKKMVDFSIFIFGMAAAGFAYFIVDPVVAWYERRRMTDEEKEKVLFYGKNE